MSYRSNHRNENIPKFRHMTWLDHPSTRAASKPLLSPSALGKSQARGVKPFKEELHSRFSSVGTHLHTKNQLPAPGCGLNHDEEIQARYQPNKKAISNKPGSERFVGYDSQYTVSAVSTGVGLSHDEASKEQTTTISNKPTVNLGGTEARFQGGKSHFIDSQGRGQLLSQENILENTKGGNPTIPKSNWLKNLWMVSGTALEDREMQQCEAIIAPVLPIHANWAENANNVVMDMKKDTAERFTFQKCKPTNMLEYDTTQADMSRQETEFKKSKGAMIRKDKHSRFSMYGGYMHS